MSENNNEPLYEKSWGIVLILLFWPFYLAYLFFKDSPNNNNSNPSADLSDRMQKRTFTLELEDQDNITVEIENEHLDALINKWHGYFEATYLPILEEQFENNDLKEHRMQWKFKHTVRAFYQNQSLMAGYKSSDVVNAVEVVACDDDRSCDHCQFHDERIYKLENAPTLPHHNCDNLKNDPTEWCRCTFTEQWID